MSSPITYASSPLLDNIAPASPLSATFAIDYTDNLEANQSPRKRRRLSNQPENPRPTSQSRSPGLQSSAQSGVNDRAPTTGPNPASGLVFGSEPTLSRLNQKAGFLAADSDSEDDALSFQQSRERSFARSHLPTRRNNGKETYFGPQTEADGRDHHPINGTGARVLPDQNIACPSTATAGSSSLHNHSVPLQPANYTSAPSFHSPGIGSSTSVAASVFTGLNLGTGLSSNSGKRTGTTSLAFTARSASGRSIDIRRRPQGETASLETMIASRSISEPGRGQKSYYGINIHNLIDEAGRMTAAAQYRREADQLKKTTSRPHPNGNRQLWTEKYRAKSFATLVGDERTHRHVLRWLKRWDPIVFPSRHRRQNVGKGESDEPPHRKLLLLAGPPGFGKTTLAHVCARQAGYEIGEINASDDRSANVVRTRIKDMLATENVQGSDTGKVGRPVCVIVDEVDGAVGSGGSGESGFVKALLDLVERDNATIQRASRENGSKPHRGKGKEKFRMLRPLMMACNDLYAPSLRLLRQSPHVEIVHVRPPPLSAVSNRLDNIFRREGIPFDPDAVRRICELSWGIETIKTAGASAMTGPSMVGGDIRSIMVTAESVATKWRAENPPSSCRSSSSTARLSRRWVEQCLVGDGTSTASGGIIMRSSGRAAGSREIVNRVFREHAGIGQSELDHLLRALSVSEAANRLDPDPAGTMKGGGDILKRVAIDKLARMIDGCGEVDRVVGDLFHSYLNRPFQDDTRLSKLLAAHRYLFFHDQVSSRVLGAAHEWELARYLNVAGLAFHDLFATSAAFANQHSHLIKHDDSQNAYLVAMANDASQKAHAATVAHMESCMPHPAASTFRGARMIVTELVPYLVRVISPDIKITGPQPGFQTTPAPGPGGKKNDGGMPPKPNQTDISATASNIIAVRKASEKTMLAIAVNAALSTGLSFDRMKIDHSDSKPDRRIDDGTETEDGAARRPRDDTESFAAIVTNPASWVYRLVPAIDTLTIFDTLQADFKPSSSADGADRSSGMDRGTSKSSHPTSFHVRRAIEAERQREESRRAMEKRKVLQPDDYKHRENSGSKVADRSVQTSGNSMNGTACQKPAGRVDFFGRPVPDNSPAQTERPIQAGTDDGDTAATSNNNVMKQVTTAWIKFNDGFSNAVRKPITLTEFLSGF